MALRRFEFDRVAPWRETHGNPVLRFETAYGIEVEDLDMDFVCGYYLPATVAAEILDQNQRTIEQQ